MLLSQEPPAVDAWNLLIFGPAGFLSKKAFDASAKKVTRKQKKG
jgi:hypothetical protein